MVWWWVKFVVLVGEILCFRKKTTGVKTNRKRKKTEKNETHKPDRCGLYFWALARQQECDNDNNNDNGHSFSQLSVHKALTCPGSQRASALAPSLPTTETNDPRHISKPAIGESALRFRDTTGLCVSTDLRRYTKI